MAKKSRTNRNIHDLTGAIAEAGGCGCHWRCAEGAGDWASSMLGLVVCSVNGDHWRHHQNAAGVKRKKKLTFWGRWCQYMEARGMVIERWWSAQGLACRKERVGDL